MEGVKEVRQLDDSHVHWHAEVWGKDKEWDAEITEHEPDKRISWKSVSGAESAGTVRFERSWRFIRLHVQNSAAFWVKCHFHTCPPVAAPDWK
jgi:uncharacterized membrane protein